MSDVYLMEVLLSEYKAEVQRRVALNAALRELDRSGGRDGDTPIARLRRWSRWCRSVAVKGWSADADRRGLEHGDTPSAATSRH
jgi:hypothetical protein